MAALNFPAGPTEGQTASINGQTWTFTSGAWVPHAYVVPAAAEEGTNFLEKQIWMQQGIFGTTPASGATVNSASDTGSQDSPFYPSETTRACTRIVVAPSVPGAFFAWRFAYPLVSELASATPSAGLNMGAGFSIEFGASVINANTQFFIGLAPSMTVAATFTNAFSNALIARMVGCGFEVGDTNLHLVKKVGGVVTKYDTGVPLTSLINGVFRITGKLTRGTRTFNLTLTNMKTGVVVVSNWASEIDTPTASIAPSYQLGAGVGSRGAGSGSNSALVLCRMAAEMDY